MFSSTGGILFAIQLMFQDNNENSKERKYSCYDDYDPCIAEGLGRNWHLKVMVFTENDACGKQNSKLQKGQKPCYRSPVATATTTDGYCQDYQGQHPKAK